MPPTPRGQLCLRSIRAPDPRNCTAASRVRLLHANRFHLKLCWVNASASASRLRLGDVRHQHRGFTANRLSDILRGMSSFLRSHPKETLALGA